MSVLAATLVAMQAVTPAPSMVPILMCHLASPVNESLDFVIIPNEDETARLIGLAGSVWPRREITVTKRSVVTVSGRSVEAYDIGTGTNPHRIILLESGQIIIYLTAEGGRLALPVAAGFCEEANGLPAVTVSTERPVNPFDPDRWLDDCGFIARNGVRGRMNFESIYRVAGPSRRQDPSMERHSGTVRISDPDTDIWINSQINIPMIVVRRNGISNSDLFRGSRDGGEPSGRSSSFEFGGRATQFIEFITLGTQSRFAEQSAIAVCGYKNVVVRATRL